MSDELSRDASEARRVTKRRYICQFATSLVEVHEVGHWKHLEDAKALCERERSIDIFLSPRVYVEELTEYPADEEHEALTVWERVACHELYGDEWMFYET